MSEVPQHKVPFIVVCTDPRLIPSFVLNALHHDEVHSNTILPAILKSRRRAESGSATPGDLWIICYTRQDNVDELLLIASCTTALLGTYPVFLYSPLSQRALRNARVSIHQALNAVAQKLLHHVGPRRVYSVFGPNTLSRTFAGIWFTQTGIKIVTEPYYSSWIACCTPNTFVAIDPPFRVGYSGYSRLAVLADLEAVARLCHIFAQDSQPFQITVEQACFEAEQLIRNQIVFVHVLRSSTSYERIVSLVAFTRNTSKMATITKVVTDPDCRGHKCAERLTRYVCHRLFESGKENIALFVGVDNPAAKVYQRVGFDGIYNAPVEGVDQWVEYGFDSARVDMGLW